ncbi:hypothetical protein PP175_03795 [Aneurinibacillus sp. Ricciae_BoGa-3]|uniref:RNA dependent RNA polymerase n=1 Tax=Aneurinibacillus sp. Ricciae_BoGa-3 TaxID=3022697 RepID=UPI00233FF038|nr:hypothetical protein [Aneurinibacillus sp. Ricciae_BoGa-3]WCK55120.1 hypothetical protein PP175_03795 [Aneurinibacillus sp. Ricciae_BoGa-3]
MAQKRRQYTIKQYRFQNISKEYDRLTLSLETAIEYPNSGNILYATLYRLLEKTYDDSDGAKNAVDELFILKADQIDQNDEKQLALYERIMREGVFIGEQKYIRFGKSSNMAMNQRTLFIREDVHDRLKETITLGKVPTKTIISKYETAIGLTLSSINLVEGLPRICIVKDLEKTLIEDVKVVARYELQEEDKAAYEEYKRIAEAEEARKAECKQKWEEVKAVFDDAYLAKFPHYVGEGAKSKSGWERENRRVQLEQIESPAGWKLLRNENKRYPVYTEEQTEEIPEIINKFSVGYEVKIIENHENQIVPHDGQGLMSFEYAKKVSDALGLSYTSNAFQIRMPYVKGLMIRFDLKTWFEEQEVTHIKDLWDNDIDITDIDIIMTESCFKAKLQTQQDGKNTWLFSSLDDYVALLKKYGHEYIGIANYAKSADRADIYTPLTYQFINSLALDYKELRKLVEPAGNLYLDILNKGDAAAVKAFLHMIIDREEYEDNLVSDVHKAIDINERMIFDPRVQAYIRKQIEKAFTELAVGRIPVKGNYQFVTGDCIALAEWMTHGDKDNVHGFLDANEFYCKGKVGQYVMMRNPLTSWHEVKKANLVDSGNAYVQHLDNVIQFNSGKDLTMAQLSGCDFDGDKSILIDNKTILDAVIDDFVIVNDDDKTTAEAKEYNIENVIEFERKNLSNDTALVTNIDTYFQSLALEQGNLQSRELEIATCKQLQAEFIDSVKKGTRPVIPDVLLEAANKKPYFQKFIYGGRESQYRKIYSPLNNLAMNIDEWLERKRNESKSLFNIEYLDTSTMDLITDMDKVDQDTFMELARKIAPIYNAYSKAKGDLWKEEQKINRLRMRDEDKEELDRIGKLYKELYDDTRNKCREVCDDDSVLASVCAYIEYIFSKNRSDNSTWVSRTKSYIFPWIVAPEGIMANLKAHEDKIKVDVQEVPQLNRREKEYAGVLRVENGAASIEDVQFKTKLKDGKYRLFSMLGYHFIDFDNERETEIELPESNAAVSTKEKVELKRLTNYACRLSGNIQDGHAVAAKIDDQIITLDQNGNFIGVFLDGEYICGIRQEDYANLTEGIFLKSYVGQPFKVQVEKINQKSLSVILNMV